MGLFNIFKKGGKPEHQAQDSNADSISPSTTAAYADSSSVSPDERSYYKDDSYYTFYSYPNTPMARKVITFKERKKTAIPSTNGLYPAEILLLNYCRKGTYPKPKSGYPGFWWFEYGIRDVGHALESLAKRGFIEWAPKSFALQGLTVKQLKAILEAADLPSNGNKADLIARTSSSIPEDQIIIPNYTPKYRLTALGEEELARNGYVPYMHAHNRKTTENDRFGETFNVWSINQCFKNGDAVDWRNVVGTIESRMFGMDIANAAPVEERTLDADSIRLFLQSHKDCIANEIKRPGSGLEEQMEGIELKKVGRDDEALVKFYIAIGKKLDTPALYREASVLLRKYNMHDEEIRVLKAGIANIPRGNKHWKDLNARLGKAELLLREG